MENSYTQRYRKVWEQTLAKGFLSEEDVAKSRYYFESDLTIPTPKAYNTFGVAALLPMPQEAQEVFNGLNKEIMQILGNPLTYSVLPENRHVELFLFSRPEEIFPDKTIYQNIQKSFEFFSTHPPQSFSIEFGFPFITPDGTIVCPGYPEPDSVIGDFRNSIRSVTTDTPTKQSQWFHTSFGRILDPISQQQMRKALEFFEENWNTRTARCTIDKLFWTHEQRWYMVDKKIIHKLQLP